MLTKNIQVQPRGDYNRFLSVLEISKRTREELPDHEGFINYLPLKRWETMTHTNKLELLSKVLVVKNERNFLQQGVDHQRYFETGNPNEEGRETALQAMNRLCISKVSHNQILGKFGHEACMPRMLTVSVDLTLRPESEDGHEEGLRSQPPWTQPDHASLTDKSTEMHFKAQPSVLLLEEAGCWNCLDLPLGAGEGLPLSLQ